MVDSNSSSGKDDSEMASPNLIPFKGELSEDGSEAFSPSNIRVNKRHTRILGTLNKRASQEFINM